MRGDPGPFVIRPALEFVAGDAGRARSPDLPGQAQGQWLTW